MLGPVVLVDTFLVNGSGMAVIGARTVHQIALMDREVVIFPDTTMAILTARRNIIPQFLPCLFDEVTAEATIRVFAVLYTNLLLRIALVHCV